MTCPFCDENNLNYRTFLESKKFLVVYNNFPLVEGHCLVIPKKHIETPLDLSPEEFRELSQVLVKSTDAILKTFKLNDFNWVMNVGETAGQMVKHIHFHIFPRKEGDFGKDPRNFFIKLTQKEKSKGEKTIPIKEIKNMTSKIRKNMI